MNPLLTGLDWQAWLLASARSIPVVLLVPAFGLRALPMPMRAAIALSLAGVLLPTTVRPALGSALGVALCGEVVRGTSTAVAAAVPLWAATTAGNVVDAIRGGRPFLDVPVVEGRTGSFGVLWSLLAAAMFLETGGPARVTSALASAGPWSTDPVARAVRDLISGIDIAVAIAAPLLAATVVLEIAIALIARATSPAQVASSLAAARSLAFLAIATLLFDRTARLLAIVVQNAPKADGRGPP